MFKLFTMMLKFNLSFDLRPNWCSMAFSKEMQNMVDVKRSGLVDSVTLITRRAELKK